MSSSSDEKISPATAGDIHPSRSKESEAAGDVSVDRESGQTLNERGIIRKMDLWFLPWIIPFLLSFFWRSNIGNGMNSLDAITPDVTFSTAHSNGGLAMFYTVFIVWALPSVLIMEKLVKPKYWISFNMVILAAAQIAMGWAKSYSSILAVRFFLAFGEACILPGLIVYLFHWYRRYEITSRVAFIFGGGILIGSLAGILAFLLNLVLNKQKGYSGYRWILTIVGLVTFIVAVLSFFILSEYPHSSHFLNDEERDHVIARVHEERDDEDEDEQGVRQTLIKVLASWRIWAFIALSIACWIPIYCYAVYSPAIIARLKNETISVRMQLTVSIPLYICAFVAVCFAGWYADKIKSRSKVIVAGCALALFGQLFLILNKSTAVQYFGIFPVCAGLYSMVPVITVWGTENYRGHVQRAIACTLIISIGQIGGVVNTRIFKAADKPEWTEGYAISIALTVVCALLAVGIARANHHHNQKRDAAVFSL